MKKERERERGRKEGGERERGLSPLSPPPPPPPPYPERQRQRECVRVCTYLLTYAHHSQWSIGHQRPPAIALCSGLLLSFRTSWSPAVSALLQCLASNCCEAGLSSSSPAGSRSGLGVWCWMLGFLRVCPIQPHFLRSICLATGSCPARSHSSSFRIFSCHWIL